MKKRFEIFSSKRLRQILNDIKRNSDIAGKELKFPKKQLNRYLKSEKTLDINLVKKICEVYPIHPQELISPKIYIISHLSFFHHIQARKQKDLLKEVVKIIMNTEIL